MKRRAFLGLLAGAAAAKALAPLMPLVADAPLTLPTEVVVAHEVTVGTSVFMALNGAVFYKGDVVMFAGDTQPYVISEVMSGGMFGCTPTGTSLLPLRKAQAQPKPKPRTYPKHFRAKQREPWFSTA